MNKKQRIVQGHGASNITYSIIVLNFDVSWLSYQVSSTNYGLNVLDDTGIQLVDCRDILAFT